MNATIKEANRYIVNAKEILSENAHRSNGIYQDKKYVKLAGHAAYCGVLYALDDLIIHPQKSKRKSVDFYRAFLSSYDKKMLVEFNNLYDILHLSMGYDGNTDAGIAKRGLEMAKEFITKIAARLN